MYIICIFMAEELFKNMHLQLSAEDIRKIDEWKISRGMKSRTEAIRAMVRIVIGSDLDENISSAVKSGFSEKEKNSFMRPENSNQKQNKNDSLEEIIRKVVKEELSKMLNEK